MSPIHRVTADVLRTHPRRSAPRVQMALTTLLVLLVSGCASLAPTEGRLPAVAVPSAWAGSSGNAATSGAVTALARWWTRFDDPQLTALVEQSLNANTSVRTAQASLQQARARVDVQSAGLAPSVGASGSAQRSRASNNTGNTFQAGFDASW